MLAFMRSSCVIVLTLAVVACASDPKGGVKTTSSGGASGTGGATTGGTTSSGGTAGSGAPAGSGGTAGRGTGGTTSTGGTASTGGTTTWNPTAGDFHYKVDQFGYLPNEEKVAVISSAQVGFNAPDSYEPGPTLEVYSWPNDILVYSGPVTPWNGGATDPLAGDKGWWFDFSPVTASDNYIIKDPKNQKRSHSFRIDSEVFDPILMHALRTYYYQREGFAKALPYADARWADSASHANDKKARSVFAKDDASTERDVYGGWMDAGDQNKYVTFLDEAIPTKAGPRPRTRSPRTRLCTSPNTFACSPPPSTPAPACRRSN
jgi:hypothetical protein